jgi:hypothetical protein
VTWSQGAGVNRYFADESLPRRETAALKACARRDPRSWFPMATNAVVIALLLAWLYLQLPGHAPKAVVDVALVGVMAFVVVGSVSYLWWELALARRVRRAVAGRARVGALLTSSFGPRALRVTTPEISYEIPYTSIQQVARFGDMFVIKPVNQAVLALPMELVTKHDYALVMSKLSRGPGPVGPLPAP